jgi:putative tricarboxylic transport membrane protein
LDISLILSDLWQGIILMFNFESLLLIAFGVFIGIVFGSIPGLTTTMCLALLIPLTYFMEPLLGIPLLIGAYKGGIYGGSIPAILLNTPGHNAAVATCFDGYPLTLQGRARSALDIALYSSVFGDTVSDIFTILFGTVVASFAILLGTPEMFSILVFCICIISVLSGDSVIKGLIGASIGMVLGSIGTDIAGRTRFLFGEYSYSGGLSELPLFLGLFAMSTVLSQIIDWHKKDSDIKKRHTKIALLSLKDRLSLREFLLTMPHNIRSTIIGTFIGLVPAVGQDTAALIGYGVAKKFAKEPEKFGKGSLEGIAGPEAANNAVNGPTLIPLFLFGVPGDLCTALMLSAFTVHGIIPGPKIFEEQGEFVYGIFAALIIANLFMFIIGKGFIKIYSYIAHIKISVLIPIIIAVAICGTFAVNNRIQDIILMILAGLVGLLLKRANIPSIPIIITFLLTPRIEKTLCRSLIIFDGNPLLFFERPFTKSLLSISILLVLIPSVISIFGITKKKINKIE